MMIALIPHIIRRPEYTEDNLRTIAAGTSTAIRLSHAPAKPLDIKIDGQVPQARVEYAPVEPAAASTFPSPAAAAPAPPAAAPAPAGMAPPATAPQGVAFPGMLRPGMAPQGMGQPGMAPPATAPPTTAPPGVALPGMLLPGMAPQGAAPPATAPPATAPPATAPPATAPPAGPPSGSGDGGRAAAAPARIRFNPLQMETAANSPAVVSVVLEGGHDVSSAPMAIRFDPKLLRLDDVTAGDLLAVDGQTPILSKSIQNDTGSAKLSLNRPPGLPGVTAPAGVLVKLSFQALGPGVATVGISSVSVRDSQGQPIAAGNPADLTINIR
jgi:hypothetical protein